MSSHMVKTSNCNGVSLWRFCGSTVCLHSDHAGHLQYHASGAHTQGHQMAVLRHGRRPGRS
jgi:hypothetical protein